VWLLESQPPQDRKGRSEEREEDVRGAEGEERAIGDRNDVKRHTVNPLSRAVRTTVEKAGPSADPAENSLKM
jgi:hypothetical protein